MKACKTVNKVSVFVTILIASLLVSINPAVAEKAQDAQAVVDKSLVTFNAFMGDPNYGWIQRNIENAKGVLIFPQVLKGGFILGGSGGTGVFLVRDQGGNWSEPAFYTIGSVTFGLQIGAQAAEVVMLAMSQKAVDSLLSSSFKLGGDTSVAVGPYGAGAAGTVTTDFVSFAKAKGAYAGLNLEGAAVTVRESLNTAYYGKKVTPVDILVKATVTNPGADRLQTALLAATGAAPEIPQAEMPQDTIPPEGMPQSETPQPGTPRNNMP